MAATAAAPTSAHGDPALSDPDTTHKGVSSLLDAKKPDWIYASPSQDVNIAQNVIRSKEATLVLGFQGLAGVNSMETLSTAHQQQRWHNETNSAAKAYTLEQFPNQGNQAGERRNRKHVSKGESTVTVWMRRYHCC